MKSKYMFLLFCIVVLTYSCGTTKCVGFSEKLTGWIPYSASDIIEFYRTDDTLAFKVLNFTKSEPLEIKSNCDCMCGKPLAEFTTDIAKNGSELNGKLLESSGEIIYCFEKDDKNDSLVYNVYSDTPKTLNYSLKDTVLTNVIEVTNNNINDVKKIYLHYGKGIVGFIDNLDREYKLILR